MEESAEPEQALAEPQEPTPDEEASDLGSPGFSGDHNPPPTNTAATTSTSHPEAPVPVAHDMYQSTGTGLSYPQAMPDNMSNGVDYSTYQQQQSSTTPSGMAYPQQQPQQYTGPAPVVQAPAPVEPVQPAAPPPPAASTRAPRPPSSRSTRRSLPSASSHIQNGYAEAVNNTQPVVTASSAPPPTTTYSNPSRTRQQPRIRNVPTYDPTPQDEHRAAATLSQVALQNANPSPTARTVSPFQNPTQAARTKSRQGQRSQSRTAASSFQQAPAQMASVDTASIYTNDQYSRYNAAATNTQNSQASSRVAYEPYQQQQQPTTTATNTTSTSTAYPNYDAYNSRSQASTNPTPGLAAPVTQGIPTSLYTKTAAPSSTGWGNPTSAGNRNTAGSLYGSTSASPTPQSFSVRPQATAQQHISKAQQQQPFGTGSRRQQTQPSFDSYSTAQSHHAASTQPQQQAQQGWYGFGSKHNSNFGSGGRGTYGHSVPNNNNNPSYGHHRSMNLTGNTYHNMNDQELYEMLKINNPGH